MDYDIAIATRNRADALRLSVPLMLAQSRKPRSLIVVDASDDPHRSESAVRSACDSQNVRLLFLTAPPNLPQQRNIALEHVNSPVVMFPDDDSLWWPGVAEHVMRVYERDEDEVIGGVCCAPSASPPPGTDLASSYSMSKADSFRRKIEGRRHAIEAALLPDPLWVHGASRWSVKPTPDWLEEENAALVEFMGGFRMSFRTEVLRKAGGFDPELGGKIGYAAYEDADASFRVAQTHLLVGARDALCYHHRFPSKRADGYRLGLFLLLNRAYIIAKYSEPGSRAHKAFRPFALYKLAQYSVTIATAHGRAKMRGTITGMVAGQSLFVAPTGDIRNFYHQLIDKHTRR